jgi:Tol biopolymer transport system component
MKNAFLKKATILIMVITLFPLTLSDCKKTDPAVKPVISTSGVFNIAATSATTGGFVSSDGGAEVTSYGICWGTNANPSTTDSKTSDGKGTGQYVSSLTGLTAGTTYHVRAYAINSVGTSYGGDMLFVTLGQSPESITLPASNISATGAILNGAANANFLSTTVTFEYGLTASYGQTIAASQSPLTGNLLTNINASISGLTVNTIYHYRLKAVNSLATTYGNDISFTSNSGGTSTGNIIVFSSNESGNSDIWKMNIDGSNKVQLTTNSAIDNSPRWSPDGSKIVFISNRNSYYQMWIMNSDGTNQTLLYNDPGYNHEGPSWSKDGNYIYYSRGSTGSGCSPCPTYEIWRVNSNGTNSLRMTNDNFRDQSPYLSPNGQKIVFAKAKSAGDCCNATDVCVMNTDGTSMQRISVLSGGYSWPGGGWSPDGSKILIFSSVTGLPHDLYIINSDGSGKTFLASNSIGGCFSKDGSKILYLDRSVSGGGDIWIMNIDGTNKQAITTNSYLEDSVDLY